MIVAVSDGCDVAVAIVAVSDGTVAVLLLELLLLLLF